MYVHLYSRGEDFLDEKLSVDEACQLIELQQTSEEEEDNFIGFTHPSSEDAVIQFIRMKKNEWILDIPMYENKAFIGSLVAEITHSQSLIVVTEFYHETAFQKAVIEQDYLTLTRICRDRWTIVFDIIKD